MEATLTGAGPVAAATATRAPPERPRVAYLDNLKLLLVAAIIAAHGIAAYSDLESAWPYQDVQEAHIGVVMNGAFAIVLLPAVLFVMGLFFLVSGLLTPDSVDHKGPRAFTRDRLVRLGVPLLVWMLVIWPCVKWAIYQVGGEPTTFWWRFVHSGPFLDVGPMWFVEVLLIYSLAYAAWRAWDGTPPVAASEQTSHLSGRTLVWLAVGISAATLLVRQAFPLASGQVGQSHLWQWPQFVAMFGLGIVAARRCWLTPVPARIRRGCGIAAASGFAAFLLLTGTMALTGTDPEVWFEQRLHWAPMILAAS
jgi:fucose 4-O-acetylase-like acetyltransferase